jgi:hypothetical protein
MASTYSPSLKLELPANGDQSGTWGTTTNNNLGTLIEQAITGVQTITMVNTDKTLTDLNGTTDEARNAVLVVGGTNSAIRNIIIPAVNKVYIVKNSTTGGFGIVVKISTSTGITVSNGATVLVYCDGTEVYTVTQASASANTVNTLVLRDGSGNFSAGTITATAVIASLASSTGLPISTGVSGLGTGIATFLATPSSANLAAALTDETGSGSAVFATSPTLVTPNLGTPTSGNLANCTFPTLNQNTTGTAAGLSATLAIASGGTGATTAGAALTALGAQASATAITTSNIGAQSVAFATTATNATNATNATTAASCSGNSATATLATNVTNAVGQGQTWQAFTSPTRVLSTNYTNSTGKPIVLSVTIIGGANITVDSIVTAASSVGNAGNSLTTIVPNSSVYSVTSGGAFSTWAELR